jgi:PAS domain S-box-containing protein
MRHIKKLSGSQGRLALGSSTLSVSLFMNRVLPSLDILAQLTDAVIALDLEGRVTFWNRGAEKLYGWGAGEAVGEAANSLLRTRLADPAFGANGVERALEPMVDSMLRDGQWQGELTRSSRAGEPIDVLSRWTVLRDDKGNAIGRLIVDTDLTETRLRFHELRLAEERAREAARIASDTLRERERDLMEAHRMAGIGTWRWERATDTVTWSEEVYRIYGVDKSYKPRSYAEIRNKPNLLPSDRLFLQAFERAERFGEPYSLDLEIPQPDGTTRWQVARGEVERWENGKVASLRGTVHEITERKRYEQQVALSENRYRSLVRASSQIVWTTNANGEQTETMRDRQAFTGQTDAEASGFGGLDAIHPEDRERSKRAWMQAIATGTPLTIEERIRRHDGVYRVMSVRAVPVRDDSGNILEWVGTHTDITEQVEAQVEVRRAHEQLQNVLDSIRDGLCVLDRDLRYVYFNENGARMCGVRAEEIVGQRLGVLFPEMRTNVVGRAYRRAMETGEPEHFEAFHGAPLNKWIESHCYPSRHGLTVYFRDITERKRIEEALREREERFRLLAEGIPQLVWLTDPEGATTYLNRRFQDYAGIEPEQVEGFDWTSILHPEDMERTMDLWTRSVETGEAFLAEYRILRADGVHRYFLTSALAMRNDAGEIERWVGSCTDIHDQRLSEEALRRSEKLAATGRLAASIAHEINNPLAAVTNSLYLALLDKSLGQETRTYLQMAEQELARVAHITTQTLRFHKQSKSSSVADLSGTMDSVLVLFGRRLAAKQIRVEREMEAGASAVCFEDEIRQVFANLVSNSLDAMGDGGRLRVRIRRAISPCAERRPGVRVTVADTGCGIPAGAQKKIFEPFFSTKDATGIGLGLWVSEGIIRKHEGSLRMKSSVDPERHGTAMSLFFPEAGPQRKEPA